MLIIFHKKPWGENMFSNHLFFVLSKILISVQFQSVCGSYYAVQNYMRSICGDGLLEPCNL